MPLIPKIHTCRTLRLTAAAFAALTLATPQLQAQRTREPLSEEDRTLTNLVRQANLEKLKTALDANPDLVKKLFGGTTLLYTAARYTDGTPETRAAVLGLLIERGADPNFSGPNFIYTPLIAALRDRRNDVVKVLLQKGADPNLPDSRGVSPLESAFQSPNPEGAVLLIEGGLNLNRWDGSGLFPLHLIAATKPENVALVKAILDRGGDANIKSRGGWESSRSNFRQPRELTPLHIAARAGNLNVIAVLLAGGVKVNAPAANGDTPLHVAARSGSTAIKPLLAAGADPNASNLKGDTPLLTYLREGSAGTADRPGIEALIAASDLSRTGQLGLSPLELAIQTHQTATYDLLRARTPVLAPEIEVFEAAAHNDAPRLKALLDAHPELAGSVTASGTTPLLAAASWSAPATTSLLLERGADPNARDGDGLTPLLRALRVDAFKPEVEQVVAALLTKKADPNASLQSRVNLFTGVDNNPERPLTRAITLGAPTLVQLLLRNGANPNAALRRGDTPLILAIRSNQPALVPLLLDAGATVDTPGEAGMTALARTIPGNDIATAKTLLAKGADPNNPAAFNITPVFFAVTNGTLEMLKLLVEAKGNVNVRGTNGEGTIQAARRMRAQDKIEYLLVQGASDTSALPAQSTDNAILAAARGGDAEKLRELLADPDAVKARDASGETALTQLLHTNAVPNLPELVNLLLEKGADPNVVTRFGATPLQIAAASYLPWGPTVVARLIEKGADLKVRDPKGRTLLHLVNNPAVAKLLIQKGLDPNAVDSEGNTPLHDVIPRSTDVMLVLLEGGADPNRVNQDGDLPIQMVEHPFYLTSSQTLLEKSDLTHRGSRGLTLFQTALISGDPKIIATAVARRPALDDFTALMAAIATDDDAATLAALTAKPYLARLRFPNGWTPLHLAARAEASKCATLLMARGADVNARDASGTTPLHLCNWGEPLGPTNRKVASLLLKSGANPNAMTVNGGLPRDLVIYNLDFEGLKLLLNAGADPNRRNLREFNALHSVVESDLAVRTGDAFVALLVQKGADINLQSRSNTFSGTGPDGLTPLMLALLRAGTNASSAEKAVPLLLKSGASVQVADDAGDNALHLAASRNLIRFLPALLAAPGAAEALQARDLNGKTPLALATAAKATAAVELLKAAGTKE